MTEELKELGYEMALMTELQVYASQLERAADGAAFVKDGCVRVKDPKFLVGLLANAADTLGRMIVEDEEHAASLSQLVKERDEARAARDASERERKLIANDWIAFCDAMGVQFDTPEAVAYQIRARAEAAERERDAIREALRPFDRLGAIILSEAPANARTVVCFKSASGEQFAMELDYFRAARSALNLNGGQSD